MFTLFALNRSASKVFSHFCLYGWLFKTHSDVCTCYRDSSLSYPSNHELHSFQGVYVAFKRMVRDAFSILCRGPSQVESIRITTVAVSMPPPRVECYCTVSRTVSIIILVLCCELHSMYRKFRLCKAIPFKRNKKGNYIYTLSGNLLQNLYIY